MTTLQIPYGDDFEAKLERVEATWGVAKVTVRSGHVDVETASEVVLDGITVKEGAM